MFWSAWNKHPPSLPEAIKSVTEEVQDCLERVRGNIFAKKKKLISRIMGIQPSPNYGVSLQLTSLEADLLKEYQLILAQ